MGQRPAFNLCILKKVFRLLSRIATYSKYGEQKPGKY